MRKWNWLYKCELITYSNFSKNHIDRHDREKSLFSLWGLVKTKQAFISDLKVYFG
ncbi:hypothetical protein MDMS009_2781 [Methylophaga thiooxydans DMS010]|uniref:Uncharacterized protein n=1 Tax=Methylophaga thiooxydans DMS010 TaxID=637616 RepID=C0N9L5_9GAMM|nr:hypothetical protein MDMS009_2781 [Methylophaga thiooxydans DMS010]